jgi:hypothetical protein
MKHSSTGTASRFGRCQLSGRAIRRGGDSGAKNSGGHAGPDFEALIATASAPCGRDL